VFEDVERIMHGVPCGFSAVRAFVRSAWAVFRLCSMSARVTAAPLPPRDYRSAVAVSVPIGAGFDIIFQINAYDGTLGRWLGALLGRRRWVVCGSGCLRAARLGDINSLGALRE